MRTVLIDESTDIPYAKPFATEAEAIAALRARIAELIADPSYYLDLSYVQDVGEGYAGLDDMPDDELLEFISEVWLQQEGSQGVWSNFSSADRWSVSGRLPEDAPFGNADTRHYGTAGKPDGCHCCGLTG